MEEKKLPLTLTGPEIIYLTDAVRNTDVAEGLPDKEAYVPLAKELLLVLGSMFNECVDWLTRQHDIDVFDRQAYFSELQVWLLRGKVRYGDVDFRGQPVGPLLLHKLYACLLQFHSEEMLAGIPLADTDSHWPADGPDKLYAGGYL